MTTEDDFQAMLDANPEDWQTRLIFADWLDERGDPRAEGYRWLGEMRLYPIDDRAHTAPDWPPHQTCPWGWRHEDYRPYPHACLPAVLTARPDWDSYLFRTRRAAEDAVARAFSRLTPERRAELVAMVSKGE
jgi:uncharacterized protein (TIGR02996 family)